MMNNYIKQHNFVLLMYTEGTTDMASSKTAVHPANF